MGQYIVAFLCVACCSQAEDVTDGQRRAQHCSVDEIGRGTGGGAFDRARAEETFPLPGPAQASIGSIEAREKLVPSPHLIAKSG